MLLGRPGTPATASASTDPEAGTESAASVKSRRTIGSLDGVNSDMPFLGPNNPQTPDTGVPMPVPSVQGGWMKSLKNLANKSFNRETPTSKYAKDEFAEMHAAPPSLADLPDGDPDVPLDGRRVPQDGADLGNFTFDDGFGGNTRPGVPAPEFDQDVKRAADYIARLPEDMDPSSRAALVSFFAKYGNHSRGNPVDGTDAFEDIAALPQPAAQWLNIHARDLLNAMRADAKRPGVSDAEPEKTPVEQVRKPALGGTTRELGMPDLGVHQTKGDPTKRKKPAKKAAAPDIAPPPEPSYRAPQPTYQAPQPRAEKVPPPVYKTDAGVLDIIGLRLGMGSAEIVERMQRTPFTLLTSDHEIPQFLEWKYEDACRRRGHRLYEQIQQCVADTARQTQASYLATARWQRESTGETIEVSFTSNFSANRAYRIEYISSHNETISLSPQSQYLAQTRTRGFWKRVYQKYGEPDDPFRIMWSAGFNEPYLIATNGRLLLNHPQLPADDADRQKKVDESQVNSAQFSF